MPLVKNLPASAGDARNLGSIPGRGKKEMATHSSIIAWEIRQTGEPGRLQFMGHEELGAT